MTSSAYKIFASLIISLILAFTSCGQNKEESFKDRSGQFSVQKSEDEWRSLLSDQAFYVLREQGTERAFSGKYWDLYENGEYRCAGCGNPLFGSETKFKSGTGWPSFYEPLKASAVKEFADYSYGGRNTEIVCGECGGHLGHVFEDGPRPTGLRYCINSAALRFVPEK